MNNSQKQFSFMKVKKVQTSQLSILGGYEVVIKSGLQTLEYNASLDRYVVSDGIVSDWIIFYSFDPQWCHDATIYYINKPIRNKLNAIAKDRFNKLTTTQD